MPKEPCQAHAPLCSWTHLSALYILNNIMSEKYPGLCVLCHNLMLQDLGWQALGEDRLLQP